MTPTTQEREAIRASDRDDGDRRPARINPAPKQRKQTAARGDIRPGWVVAASK